MKKIIANHSPKCKYSVLDSDGNKVNAFEFIFDDKLLNALESLQDDNLESYKVKGQLLTDTGQYLSDCSLLIEGESKSIFYEGFLRNEPEIDVDCIDSSFDSIACELQEQIELFK